MYLQSIYIRKSTNLEIFLESSTVEDLKGAVEMNDEEFKKALFEFLEHIQDHTLRNSLSSFVRGIYRKNGEGLQDLNDDELKRDRKSTRLNSSHNQRSRMPSSA